MWAVFVAVFFLLLTNYTPERVVQEQVSYSEFVDKVESDQVASVMIVGDRTIMGQYKSGASFTTYIPFIADPQLARRLTDRNVIVSGKPAEGPSLLLQMLISWLPFFILIGLWVWIMRQAQGGGGMGKGGPLSFGRSRAKMTSGGNNKVTFKDVAGIDECLDQVKEFVDFLKNPKKFQQLGGTIPKGALLMGSPGTGKTLLAKAVAGEADVPFFSISGSDFVEMFVGVGAARVRDMFEQAKKHAPSIIFIDEIDAVGRHRGAGVGGG